MLIIYLKGSVRWSSWTFCTFLLEGSVVVVEDWGVQDTELALEGVLLTLVREDDNVEVSMLSSSDPGQLEATAAAGGAGGGAGEETDDDDEASDARLADEEESLLREWEKRLGKLIG